MALHVTVLIRLGDQCGRLAVAHVALPAAASRDVPVCPGTRAGHVVISPVCISVLLKNALKRENAACLQGSLICTLGYVSGVGGVPLWRLIGLSTFRLVLHLLVQGLWFPWEQCQAGAPSEVCPAAALRCTQVAISPPRSCSVAPCGCPNALGAAVA